VVSAPAPAPSPCPVYVRGTSKNDTLTVRAANDLVIEAADGGTDLVVAYVNYTLGNNLENLSLKGEATRAIGNSLANVISGSTGNDFVDGQSGDDKAKGMDGNDEVLGGAGNDWLEGNGGHDILNGGSGADTLFGGQGADAFCFDSGESIATATMAGDRIVDFEIGDLITVDGATLDLASLTDLYVARANYANAFAAAETLTIGGADWAIIHGDSDSWLFWDANGDGHVDNGVTLALASLTRAAWAGPDGTL
jgi:Ca2+-binding RTX toxin-like protein